MQLSMSGEYALRAMLHLCSEPYGTVFQISDIALKNEIPDNFLRKILPQLKKEGILKSQRGNGGGISLLRKPSEITPWEIVQIADGPVNLNKCLVHDYNCKREKYCSIHVLWLDTQQQIKLVLTNKNMEELAEQNKRNLLELQKTSA